MLANLAIAMQQSYAWFLITCCLVLVFDLTLFVNIFSQRNHANFGKKSPVGALLQLSAEPSGNGYSRVVAQAEYVSNPSISIRKLVRIEEQRSVEDARVRLLPTKDWPGDCGPDFRETDKVTHTSTKASAYQDAG